MDLIGKFGTISNLKIITVKRFFNSLNCSFTVVNALNTYYFKAKNNTIFVLSIQTKNRNLMSKPFVFNDQNQANSYGFRILTAGISLERFNKNPVMLNQHWNSTDNVLGKWKNVRLENDTLIGEPVFDVEDPDALKISGKVERNMISSCSMGITFKSEDLKIVGTELIMEKCELYECSIVAVPSNANSIRLYAENGELLKEEDVKQLCLSLQPTEEPINLGINQDNIIMKKIILTLGALTALGFDTKTPEVDVEAVETAVLSLSNENSVMKAKLLALEVEVETAQNLAIDTMVTLAITAGKIPATKKEDFVNLAKANFTLCESTLSAIPAKVDLAASIVPNVQGAVATKEDFMKLSDDAKLSFKTTRPDEYKKLFNVKK